MSTELMTNLAYWSALVLPGISMLILCMFDVRCWTSQQEFGRSVRDWSALQYILCLVLFLSIAQARSDHHLNIPTETLVLLMGIGSFLGFCTIYAIVRKRLQL